MDLRLVRLPLRVQRRLLTACAVVLAGGYLAVVLILALPLDLPQVRATTTAVSASQPGARAAVPLEGYAVIWQRDLQRLLYDPKQAVPAPPKLNVQLLGTATDPSFTYAIFRTASGDSKLVRIGQEIDGATVVEVTADSATLRQGDRQFHLSVVRKEGP